MSGNNNNTQTGGGGNDTLSGNSGNNFIMGGAGSDFIDGGAGNDTLDGGTGNDTLLGGAGNDRLDGGDGKDTLDGGDAISVNSGALGVNGIPHLDIDDEGNITGDVTFGSNNPTQSATFGYTITDGLLTSDDNLLTPLVIDPATVTVTNVNSLTLIGTNGAEILIGGYRSSYIDGGAGDDVVIGGASSDFLLGGSGDDLFIFSLITGTDTIGDFQSGDGSVDRIDLTAWSSVGEFDYHAMTDLLITESGGDTTIHLGELSGPNKIVLLGVSAASLDEDGFIFSS